MDIRQFQGSSKYLKAADLQGRTVLLTIRGVAAEKMGDDGEEEIKPVIYFEGTDKGLTVNTTNGNVLGEAFGYETDTWRGRQIQLFATQTTYKGKPCQGLRVGIPGGPPQEPLNGFPGSQPTAAPQAPLGVPAAQTQAAMKAETTDEIPF